MGIRISNDRHCQGQQTCSVWRKTWKFSPLWAKKGLQCNFSAIGAVTRATMRHCEWWFPREQGLRPGFQDLDWQSSVSPLQETASTKCIGPSNHRFNWCYFYWIKQRCYFGNHLLVSGKELETMILSQNASNRKYWNKCKKNVAQGDGSAGRWLALQAWGRRFQSSTLTCKGQTQQHMSVTTVLEGREKDLT